MFRVFLTKNKNDEVNLHIEDALSTVSTYTSGGNIVIALRDDDELRKLIKGVNSIPDER